MASIVYATINYFLIFKEFVHYFRNIEFSNILIAKLTKKRCSYETLNLLKWYLNQITLQVNEDCINRNRGSPQGGIASPFLWLVYMDDLLDDLEELSGLQNVFAFADDLMIYCTLTLTKNIIRRIMKWSVENKIKVNEKKSAVLPLAKTKKKNDNFRRSIMKIPYVAQYKYLGITFDYTMRFGGTLDRVSKQVRNMHNYKVLGSTEMSLSQRLSIWKTYFYSKLLYPLATLSLMDKTAVVKISSRISKAFKTCLGLNNKLPKEVMYGWLQELTSLERADLAMRFLE